MAEPVRRRLAAAAAAYARLPQADRDCIRFFLLEEIANNVAHAGDARPPVRETAVVIATALTTALEVLDAAAGDDLVEGVVRLV